MAESEPKRLPFEPKKRKKKTPVSPQSSAESRPQPSAVAASSAKATPVGDRSPDRLGQAATGRKSGSKSSPATLEQTRIPDRVSRRMVSRIMIFSGLPTLVGITIFFLSYVVVTRKLFEIPNVAVLLVSIGCFGLGVLGLSYGVLSASWEEEVSGSPLGWQEFRTNLGRFLGAWRDFRQNQSSKSG